MEFRVEKRFLSWVIFDEPNMRFLWKDLKPHGPFTSDGREGYYATKAEAERYLRAYEVSQMGLTVKQNTFGSECHGLWYVSDGSNNYLHKDLEIHRGTGSQLYGRKAPGYYSNWLDAEITLREFKEKHEMKYGEININVNRNGVEMLLHEISEETLLKIREASKPKPVPVFQVCDSSFGGKRLIVRLPKDKHFGDFAGKYVSFFSDNNEFIGVGSDNQSFEVMVNECGYKNIRKLCLDRV